MLIAVSTAEPNLNSQINPHFARCQFFLIINPETMEFEVMDNTRYMADRGAGIPSAQAIIHKGVNVVLTGKCGPNAFYTLSGAGVKVITDVSGPIPEVIKSFIEGKFQSDSQPNPSGDFGMRIGQRMGRR